MTKILHFTFWMRNGTVLHDRLEYTSDSWEDAEGSAEENFECFLSSLHQEYTRAMNDLDPHAINVCSVSLDFTQCVSYRIDVKSKGDSYVKHEDESPIDAAK